MGVRLLALALALALALGLTVAGCGGGGGDSGTAELTAADAVAAEQPPATPLDHQATAGYDAQGWAIWQRRSAPVYSGAHALVGDPSVLRDGNLLRMFHTCYDVERQGPAICQATSVDGLAWTPVPMPGSLPGRMLTQRPGKWDDTHETPLAIRFRGEVLLYYAGYRDRGGHLKSFPIQIGLATSIDGVHFTLASDEPVLTVSPAGFDADAVFSPAIVEHQGRLVMLYTAYCMDTCTRAQGVYLMAATSDDGRRWTRIEQPVIDPSSMPPGVSGIAEVHLSQGPDQQYYLFATYLYEAGQGHEIGIGRAPSPLGPWQLSAAPIVRRSAAGFDDLGPIAPTVLIEAGQARMWFHGFSSGQQVQIGYAQATWPLHAP